MDVRRRGRARALLWRRRKTGRRVKENDEGKSRSAHRRSVGEDSREDDSDDADEDDEEEGWCEPSTPSIPPEVEEASEARGGGIVRLSRLSGGWRARRVGGEDHRRRG